MDHVAILLYCFYACLQMYFLMFIGMIGVKKKILTVHNSKIFSTITFIIIIPFNNAINVGYAGTYDILKLIWIIELNFIIAMIISYLLTIICHYLFKMEVRTKQSFAAMCSFPAVGALPLVIGYGFCFPGGPIEHDPYCNKFLGIMILSVMVLNYALFVFGYILILLDRKTNENIMGKIGFIWHEFIKDIHNGKNYTIIGWFDYFFKEDKKDSINEIYDNFSKENELPGNYGYITTLEKLNLITMKYYNNALNICEENIDLNDKNKINELIELKEKININLNNEPIKYPTNYTLKISPSDEKYIDKKYIEWEEKIKEQHTNFKGEKSNVHIHKMLILKSLISPPTIGFTIGILLGVSKIRDLIWDGNIYFANLMDGIDFFHKVLTPFLFLVIGVACMPKQEKEKKEKKPILITKIHFIIIFVLRFLIIPFLGILAVFLWKKLYKKECESSTVFRLILFFPWCLPSSTTFSVLVNMSGYFFEEYGYLIMLQNFSCIITLTLLNMIYFFIVGQ